jgi:hypothetical protein
VAYKLLDKFREVFEGSKYRHRRSNAGDQVASFLYEDLFALGRSPKFNAAVTSQSSVINIANVSVGKSARRGDGTFGERVPGIPATISPAYSVAFGQVATVDIGIEIKILAKAMIKQLDRVGTDMTSQAAEFLKHGGKPIRIGIVGFNHALTYTSYESDREWPTNGRNAPHPFQEAEQAEQRLTKRVSEHFDEVVTLRFRASNVSPFPFEWLDLAQTEKHYAASLLRIAREYEHRF